MAPPNQNQGGNNRNRRPRQRQQPYYNDPPRQEQYLNTETKAAFTLKDLTMIVIAIVVGSATGITAWLSVTSKIEKLTEAVAVLREDSSKVSEMPPRVSRVEEEAKIQAAKIEKLYVKVDDLKSEMTQSFRSNDTKLEELKFILARKGSK